MRTKRHLLWMTAACLVASALVLAQNTPLTPIGQLRGRTDSTGALYVTGNAATGSAGPLTPIAQLRGTTDSSGNLNVTLAGGTGSFGNGTAAAPSITFASETDLGLYRIGTSVLGVAEANAARWAFDGSGATWDFAINSAGALKWSTTLGSASDLYLFRDAAAVLALKNAANAQTFRVYGTTTGPKYLSLSHDGTNGVIDTAASSGTVSIAPTNATSVTIGKAVTSLAGQATSGALGVTTVVASGRLTAQTAAQASVSTVTVGAADASFEVSANVLVTTATTHNFTVTCAYTDEGNTARTLTLGFTQLSGATFLTAITNVTGAGPYESPVYHIRAKAATAITIATTGTFTTVTYNVEGIIKRTA